MEVRTAVAVEHDDLAVGLETYRWVRFELRQALGHIPAASAAPATHRVYRQAPGAVKLGSNVQSRPVGIVPERTSISSAAAARDDCIATPSWQDRSPERREAPP